VYELGECDALGVPVEPGNQDAHGGHGCYESWKSFAVRRSCAEEVDHWGVPESPEPAEDRSCGKNGETLAQFWVGEAGPADFFEESGEEAESDADPEAVWRVDGRYERFETEKNAEDLIGTGSRTGRTSQAV
jgi:hypothetical protein